MGNCECGWWHVQAWICGLPYLNRPRQIRFGMSREQSQDRWCRIFSFPAFGMCLQALRLHQHPRSQLTPSSFSPLIRRAQRPRVSMIAATTRPPGGDAQQVLKKKATCSRCGVTEPIEKFHVGRRDQFPCSDWRRLCRMSRSTCCLFIHLSAYRLCGSSMYIRKKPSGEEKTNVGHDSAVLRSCISLDCFPFREPQP